MNKGYGKLMLVLVYATIKVKVDMYVVYTIVSRDNVYTQHNLRVHV